MMERNACAPNVGNQLFAALLQFLQIRRTPARICRSGENEIRDFEVAHRAIVRGRLGVDFFRDTQRRFTHFVGRPGIADNRRINFGAGNHERVIANLRAGRGSESHRDHDIRVGRTDEEAELFESVDF